MAPSTRPGNKGRRFIGAEPSSSALSSNDDDDDQAKADSLPQHQPAPPRPSPSVDAQRAFQAAITRKHARQDSEDEQAGRDDRDYEVEEESEEPSNDDDDFYDPHLPENDVGASVRKKRTTQRTPAAASTKSRSLSQHPPAQTPASVRPQFVPPPSSAHFHPPPVSDNKPVVKTQVEAQQTDVLTGFKPRGDPNKPKDYACLEPGCEKAFARKSDLSRHERIHTNERPFTCPREGCNRSFIQRSALTVHERVHSGERPHRCTQCDRAFSDSSSLARHRRIHTGMRPYKCEIVECAKTFCRKTTLIKHTARHHPDGKMHYPDPSEEKIKSSKVRPASQASNPKTSPSTRPPAAKKSKPAPLPARKAPPRSSDSFSDDFSQGQGHSRAGSPVGGEGRGYYEYELPPLRVATGSASSWAPPRGRRDLPDSQLDYESDSQAYDSVQELSSYPRPQSAHTHEPLYALDDFGQPYEIVQEEFAHVEEDEGGMGEFVPVTPYDHEQHQPTSVDWYQNLPVIPERPVARTDPGDRSPSPDVGGSSSSAPPTAVPSFLAARSHSYSGNVSTSSEYGRHHASTVVYEPVEVEEARLHQEQQAEALYAANAAYDHIYGDEEIEVAQSTPYISSAATGHGEGGSVGRSYPSPRSYAPAQVEWAPPPPSSEGHYHTSYSRSYASTHYVEEQEYDHHPSASAQEQFLPHQLHSTAPSPTETSHSSVAHGVGRGMDATLGHALPPTTSPLIQHRQHSYLNAVGPGGSPVKIYGSTSASSPRLASLTQQNHHHYVSPPTSHLSAPSNGIGGVPGFSTLVSHSSPRQHYLSVPSHTRTYSADRFKHLTSPSNLSHSHSSTSAAVYDEQPHYTLNHHRLTSEEEIPRALYGPGEDEHPVGLGIAGAGEMEGSLREAHGMEGRWPTTVVKTERRRESEAL